MKNSIELMVSFYALQKLGVTVAWLNPTYRKNEAEFILQNSGAKGVLIFEKWDEHHYLDDISTLKKKLPELESIIVVGKSSGPGVYSFLELIQQGQL